MKTDTLIPRRFWPFFLVLTVLCAQSYTPFFAKHGLMTVSWVIALSLVIFSFSKSKTPGFFTLSKEDACGVLFILLGSWYLIAAIHHLQDLRGIKFFLKFGMLGLLFFSLNRIPLSPSLVRRTFYIVALINLVPFLLHAMLSPFEINIIAISTSGRLDSPINSYGSLWKLGFFISCLSLPDTIRMPHPKNFLWLALGLFLCGADGARTAVLLIATIYLIILFYSVAAKRFKVYSFVVLFSVPMLTLSPILMSKTSSFAIRWERAIAILLNQELLPQLPDFNEEIRLEMIAKSYEIIGHASFWGTGIGSTGVETSRGFQGLHNAFLQSLGDVGIPGAGFLSLILFCWIYTLRQLRITHRLTPPLIPYTLIAATWWMNFLFQPVSTELYEWLTYLVSLSILSRASKSPRPIP